MPHFDVTGRMCGRHSCDKCGCLTNTDPDYNHAPEDEIPYTQQEHEDNKGDLECHRRREE
jgi:hypothetical protein